MLKLNVTPIGLGKRYAEIENIVCMVQIWMKLIHMNGCSFMELKGHLLEKIVYKI